jgi:transcriptional regulator with XRE-family HTH domain
MYSIDEINQLIENKGISQTELAKLVGMHQGTLWKNLTKKSKMNIDTYQKIISVLTNFKQYDNHYRIDNNDNSSYAEEEEAHYYSKNDEYVDKIKALENTINNLMDQNKKLLEIISKLLENK